MNLFINNTKRNYFKNQEFNSLNKELNSLLRYIKKKKNDFENIYIVGKNLILDKDGKIIKNKDNITFLYSDNFTYSLKQLSLLKKIYKNDYIFSPSVWELYLSEHLNLYKNGNSLKKVEFEKVLEKYGIQETNKSILNDFIFLYEKNEIFSLGEKKTRELFYKYGDISNVLKNIDNIENNKIAKTIEFQRERIQYYLLIKNLFLNENDLINKRKKGM